MADVLGSYFSGQITRSSIDDSSFLNKSWKMSWPQVRPRACTSAPLVELSQLDGCEPELFGQGRHGSGRVLVDPRRTDEPVAPLDDRVGGPGGADKARV